MSLLRLLFYQFKYIADIGNFHFPEPAPFMQKQIKIINNPNYRRINYPLKILNSENIGCKNYHKVK